MADFADLGMRFLPVQDQAANRALDQVTEKSTKAEKATDALAASQKRARTATGELAASAQAAQAQVVKFEAAQNGSAAASARLAQRAREAAQAVQAQATAATSAGQAVGSMSGLMTGALVAFAALALAARGIAAAFQEARKAMTFADDLVKSADKIGVSTKRLQELQYAAAASGIATGDVASSLGRLNGVLGDIQTGGASKDLLQVFKGLGFTPEQLNSYRSANDLLPKVAEAISQLGTHAERVKVAEMLGLSDLLPLLEKGSRNLSDLTAEADRLGVTLDEGAVRQAAELNRQLAMNDEIIKSRLTQAFLDLAPAIKGASDLMVGIANGLAGLVDWAGKAATAIEDWAKRHKNAVMAAAAAVLPGGMGTAQTLAAMMRQPDWSKMTSPDRSFTVDRPASRLIFDPPKASTSRAAKTPTIRDTTDERNAQVEAALAQAAKDELQARLTLAREVSARAEIEKQIAAATLTEQRAQVDKQIATIADDKGLSALSKQRLTAELELVKIEQARTAGLKAQATDEATARALAKEAFDLQTAQKEAQLDLLDSQANLTRSSYARAVIDLEILKVQQQLERAKLMEVTAANGATETEVKIAQAKLAVLDQIQANQTLLAKQETTLLKAVQETVDAVGNLKSALQRHDWGAVFSSLVQTIQTIQAAFKTQGMAGGLAATGSAVSSLIGGKTGAALSGAFGIASAGLGLGAFAGTAAGAAALGTIGLGSAVTSIAALAGPIGIAAAAIYAAVKLLNVGGKPTNAGAGYDLITGAVSGNKRTSETESAARGAGQAIAQAQDLIRQAGIKLGATVNGLVIGTRDLTQIYLSNGKTLTSAVGDAAAATDTAVRAMLEGATYASEAQKKVVEAALATGKGFEAVTAALDAYAQAQGIATSLADQILQLTDPKSFDIQAVHRDIEAQRQAVKAAADAGYLTADQLSGINDQLARLESLKVDEAMKRYANAANDNAEALRAAYDREAEAIQATIDKFQSLADSLKKFRASLDTGPAASLSPEAQYQAARTAFLDVSAKAKLGDADALGNLQSVSQSYLDASKAYYATSANYFQDLEQVKVAVTAAQGTAQRTADNATQQLSALKEMVGHFITLEQGVLSVRDAILALQASLLAQTPTTTTPAAGGFNGAGYLAANPDVAYAYQQYTQGTGYYTQFYAPGLTAQQFAEAHYNMAGKDAGYVGFASGGSFMVGGSGGTDSQNFGPMNLNPGEMVSVTHGPPGGDTAGIEAKLEAMLAELRADKAQRAEIARQQARQNQRIESAVLDVKQATKAKAAA